MRAHNRASSDGRLEFTCALAVVCLIVAQVKQGFALHTQDFFTAIELSGERGVSEAGKNELKSTTSTNSASASRLSKRAHADYLAATANSNNMALGEAGAESPSLSSLSAIGSSQLQQQPPSELVFGNQTGAAVQCGVALDLARSIAAAAGDSQPAAGALLLGRAAPADDIVVRWEKESGEEIEPVLYASPIGLVADDRPRPVLRSVRPSDGALVFEPFRGADFRPEVHSGVYRCAASSVSRGASLLSRDMRVRAVVASQQRELQSPLVEVLDELVLEGNSAVFKCQIPVYAQEYLQVLEWVEYPSERALTYQSTTQPAASHLFRPSSQKSTSARQHEDAGLQQHVHRRQQQDIEQQQQQQQIESLLNNTAVGRYLVAPKTGDLHIVNVDASFNYRAYKCRCKNKLTGELIGSVNKGKLIVTESHSPLAPRLASAEPARQQMVYSEGELALLSCNVQSAPRAQLTWLRRAASNSGESGGAAEWMSIATGATSSNNKYSQVANLLLINKLHRNDSGAYLCQARNSAGEERLELELQVRAPLKVSLKASARVLELGKSLALDCQVSGYPIHQVVFRHNRNIIKSVSGQAALAQMQQQHRGSKLGSYFVVDGGSGGGGGGDLMRPPVVAGTAAADQANGVQAKAADAADSDELENKLSHVIVIVLEPQHAGAYQCFAYNQYESVQASTYIRVLDDPPRFKETFASELYEQRQDVSLLCSARANPLPEITWSVDEQPIPESARTRFGDFVTKDNLVISYVNISNTQVTDSGLYRCTADNGLAQISHQAQVSVIGPLQVKPMANATVVAGTAFRVRCPVAGHPLGDVHWQHNGRRLPANHRQHVYENGTLLVEHMEKSQNDEGEYTCVAATAGSGQQQQQVATGSLHVSIRVRPTIEPFSVSRSLREGQRASITCTISSGDLPISISWFRNDQQLVFPPAPSGDYSGNQLQDSSSALDAGGGSASSAQVLMQPGNHATGASVALPGVRISRGSDYSSTLLFESLLVKHSGNYTCLARNEAGSVSHQAPMVVQVAPKWSLEPSDTNVVRGSSMSIDCIATGFPQPRIIWTKAGDSASSQQQQQALQLSATAASASVPAPTSAKQNLVHPTGTWRSIVSSPHLQVYENGSLNILDARDSDFGFYMCQASNGVGPGLSKVIRVTINVAAQFSARHSVQYVAKGEPVQLKCQARGDAPLVIHWFKNKNHLEPVNGQDATGANQLPGASIVAQVLMMSGGSGSLFHTMASTLTQLQHQQQQSKGSVLERVGALLASGGGGGEQGKQQGILMDRYSLATGEQLALNSRGAPISAGATTLVKQQYNNNNHLQPIVVQVDSVLSISQAERQDTSTLKCLAVNHFGLDERTIQLVVQEPPERVEELSALEQNSRSIALAWLAPYDGNSPITQYHVQYKQAPPASATGGESQLADLPSNQEWLNYTLVAAANQQAAYSNSSGLHPAPMSKPLGTSLAGASGGRSLVKLTINLLRPITRYWFRVSAENKLGFGPVSAPIEAVTAEEAPGAAPSKLRAVAQSSSSVLVSWARLSERETVGSVHGYYVAYRLLPATDDGSNKSATSNQSSTSGGGGGGASSTNIYKTVQHDDKLSKFEASLTGLKRSSKYLVSVQAFNGRGTGPASEPVVVRTLEMDPPKQVRLYVKQATNCSVQLEWRPLSQAAIFHQQLMKQAPAAGVNSRTGDGSPGQLAFNGLDSPSPLPQAMAQQLETAKQSSKQSTTDTQQQQQQHLPPDSASADVVDYYSLNVAEFSATGSGGGQWQEVRLPGHASGHLVDGLRCGTRYQVYLVGVNRIGPGEPSEKLEARTAGEVPRAPDTRASFDVINTTCYIVRLDHWEDMGCPISEFSVRYKAEFARDWTQLVQFKLATEPSVGQASAVDETLPQPPGLGGQSSAADTWQASSRVKRQASAQSDDTYLFSANAADDQSSSSLNGADLADEDSLLDYGFGNAAGELGDYVASNCNEDKLPYLNSTLFAREDQPPNLQLMNLLKDSMQAPSFASEDTIADMLGGSGQSFAPGGSGGSQAKLPPVAQEWQASNFVEMPPKRQNLYAPNSEAGGSGIRFAGVAGSSQQQQPSSGGAIDWRRVRLCNLVENTYYTVQVRASNQVGASDAELRLLTSKEGLEYDEEIKRQVVGRLDGDGERLGQLVSGTTRGGLNGLFAMDQWPALVPIMLTVTLMTVIVIAAFLLKRSHESSGSTTTTTTTTMTSGSGGSGNRCQGFSMNHPHSGGGGGGFKGLNGAGSALTEATIGSDLLLKSHNNGQLDEHQCNGLGYSMNGQPTALLGESYGANQGSLAIYQQHRSSQSVFEEPAYGIVGPMNQQFIGLGSETTNRSSSSPATTTAAATTASLSSAPNGCGNQPRGVYLCSTGSKDLENSNQTGPGKAGGGGGGGEQAAIFYGRAAQVSGQAQGQSIYQGHPQAVQLRQFQQSNGEDSPGKDTYLTSAGQMYQQTEQQQVYAAHPQMAAGEPIGGDKIDNCFLTLVEEVARRNELAATLNQVAGHKDSLSRNQHELLELRQQQQQQCNMQAAELLASQQFLHQQQLSNGGNYATIAGQQHVVVEGGGGQVTTCDGAEALKLDDQVAGRLMFDPVYATIRRTFPQAFKYLTLQQHHHHNHQSTTQQHLQQQQQQHQQLMMNDNPFNQRHLLGLDTDPSLGQALFDNTTKEQNLLASQISAASHALNSHQPFHSNNLAALNLLTTSVNQPQMAQQHSQQQQQQQ